MIRKLTQADHDQLFDYLKEEDAINLFTIGDLEVFGYETDIQDVYADLDETGAIRGILFRFYNTYIPYTKGTCDFASFGEIVKRDAKLEMVQGKGDVVRQFLDAVPGLPLHPSRDTYFAQLKGEVKLDPNADTSGVKKAALADIDRILDLRGTIAEFPEKKNARESLLRVMESGMGRTFYIEEDGQMIACASTTAENSLSAMIVGVCTRAEHRKKGLASLCMQALCRELIGEGRSLCLFYDNPAAGSIYKRLGFVDIGMWSMCHAL